MGNKILVLGGAGFLGRHLARALADKGHLVTVVDNLSCSNSTFSCEELQHPGITCRFGSVFDRDLLDEVMPAHSHILHLASVVGVEETIVHALPTIENLDGTLNVVRRLTADQVALFTSSADVYGLHSRHYDRPMRETDLLILEDARVNRWVYAHVKALEENLIANSAARSSIIRVFNSYGPGMDYPAPKRVVPHFLDCLFAQQPLRLSLSGQQRRSFCYVGDTIDGMVRALDYTASQARGFSDTFNIGSAHPISIAQLATTMIEIGLELGLIDRPLPIIEHGFHYSQSFDDSWHRAPDISHARERLGFVPRTELREGLLHTVAYYKALRREPAAVGNRAAAREDTDLVGATV